MAERLNRLSVVRTVLGRTKLPEQFVLPDRERGAYVYGGVPSSMLLSDHLFSGEVLGASPRATTADERICVRAGEGVARFLAVLHSIDLAAREADSLCLLEKPSTSVEPLRSWLQSLMQRVTGTGQFLDLALEDRRHPVHPHTILHGRLSSSIVVVDPNHRPVILGWLDACRGPAGYDLGQFVGDYLEIGSASAAPRSRMLIRAAEGFYRTYVGDRTPEVRTPSPEIVLGYALHRAIDHVCANVLHMGRANQEQLIGEYLRRVGEVGLVWLAGVGTP